MVLTGGLVRFDGCDALIDYLHTEYLARVGPWGFNRGGWEQPAFRDGTDVGDLFEEGGIAEESASVEGVDYSGTNVQEAGVDEADIVKTDGRRIFTLSSGQLVVVDASGRTRTGTVTVAEGWGRELFIDGDSLLVITRSTSDAPDGSETVIQRIDVSGGSPEIVETLNVQGSYISARSVGGTARVILRYDPQWNFPFVYPESEAGADAAREANRAAVLNSTLDDWLPHYALDAADSSTGPRLTSCDDVHAPSVFSGFGMTTVVSVPIDGDFDPSESTAVMAPGDTVYASLDSLYVATTRWVESEAFDDEAAWEDAWRQRRTSLHRFDISGDEADYESSGAVLGVIHNQFSLSEHNGHLRVVTTIGDPWGDESESHVRVLSTDGDVLVEVGSVGDIGRGEQVQSVRFVGDIGYVVTFRQIDPFYTVDLSDPADPTIVGELKIAGFSSYLHPISDTLVLGVGSDADEDGRVTGAKISLFDVSDLTAPREVTVWTAPDGWNDVGWDHRAFLWWAPEGLAVIPLRVWEADREWSGAVALRVAEGAITEAGRIEHTPGAAPPPPSPCRHITPEDLPAREAGEVTQLEEIVGWLYVLACEADEEGLPPDALFMGLQGPVPPEEAPPGWPRLPGLELSCDPVPLSEEEQAIKSQITTPDETINYCWINVRRSLVVRSIVIGDDLWTLSYPRGNTSGDATGRLEVNDLDRRGPVARSRPAGYSRLPISVLIQATSCCWLRVCTMMSPGPVKWNTHPSPDLIDWMLRPSTARFSSKLTVSAKASMWLVSTATVSPSASDIVSTAP